MVVFKLDIRDLGIEEAIADAVCEDDDLVRALANVEQHDPKADLSEDTFSVESVELLAGGDVKVTYQYEWGAYYGCSDRVRGELETNEVVGRIEGGHLVFRIDLPEPRSTEDEL